ncbi:MAG: DUF3046 domain-containing protein [Frankiaceae bacterium]
MRLTEFWRLMEDQFGSSYAASLAQDHVLYGLGGATVSQALDRGDDPKRVWQRVCDEFEVPANRR